MRAVILATLAFCIPLVAGLDQRASASASRHVTGSTTVHGVLRAPSCAPSHLDHAGELVRVGEPAGSDCVRRDADADHGAHRSPPNQAVLIVAGRPLRPS